MPLATTDDGSTRPRLGFRVAYAIWLFGIFSYFVPPATWSPVSRFATTRAIVEKGTLSIDAFATSTGDRALVHGRWYSDKAPLVALAAVPVYAGYFAFDALRGGRPQYTAIGTEQAPARRVYVNASFRKGLYVCSITTAAAAAAALGVLLFTMLRRRTSPGVALFASAATVLATPVLPYATSFYGHVPAGAFLFGALAAVDTKLGSPFGPKDTTFRVAGACLAAAVGCEYILGGVVTLIGIWILFCQRAQSRRALVDLAVGGAIPIGMVAAYHWACFGAPWKTGYSFIPAPEFAAGHATGLLGVRLPTLEGLHGLLAGERRGLFYVSPLAAVGAAGAVVYAIRSRDTVQRMSLAAGVLLLLLNGGYYMWWGGAAAGPRHWVPAIGCLAFGVAWAARKRGWRPFVVLLALLSFSHGLVLAAVGIEAPEQGDVLREYAYRLLVEGKIAHMSGASNLAVEMGLAPAASLGPLLAWILLGARYLARRLMDEPSAAETTLVPAE